MRTSPIAIIFIALLSLAIAGCGHATRSGNCIIRYHSPINPWGQDLYIYPAGRAPTTRLSFAPPETGWYVVRLLIRNMTSKYDRDDTSPRGGDRLNAFLRESPPGPCVVRVTQQGEIREYAVQPGKGQLFTDISVRGLGNASALIVGSLYLVKSDELCTIETDCVIHVKPYSPSSIMLWRKSGRD